MATGLHSWSQTANNNGTADSAISWPEGMAPSAVNDSARGMMAVLAKYRDDTAGTITTDGSSTAYTASPSTTFVSFSELNGQVLYLKMHTTSGATPTLNVNALGAKNIKSVSGTNIATGYLLEGGIYAFTYNSSNNEFVVHGVAGALGTLASATITALSIGTSITPSSSDGAALGSASLMFSDLFLASEAVINFNNGDVSIIHAANALTFSGATTYSFTGTAQPSSNDGASLGQSGTAWSDLFLASGAIINFNAGDVTVTHSGNALAFAGGAYSFDGQVTANNSAGIVGRNVVKAYVYFTTDGSGNVTIQGTAFNVSGVAAQTVESSSGWRLSFSSALSGTTYTVVAMVRHSTPGAATFIASTRNTGTFDFLTLIGGSATRGNITCDITVYENA